jgi:hypothetical protein
MSFNGDNRLSDLFIPGWPKESSPAVVLGA